MSNFVERLKLALKETKRVSSLTGTALLLSLNVVVNQITTISLSPTQNVGISFLTFGVCGMLYGPILGGMSGVVADIIKYMLKPTGPFFPGFTFNEFVIGFLYGAFFYKKEITLTRVFLARFSCTVLVNLFLNPLWLSMLYGKGFWVLLSARLVKNIVMLPFETAMLYFIVKWVSKLRKSHT